MKKHWPWYDRLNIEIARYRLTVLNWSCKKVIGLYWLLRRLRGDIE